MRKKRPGDKKGGKGEKGGPGDEEGLVENEEEDLKEEENSAKPNSEYLGKLQYELKYDFNTQTLIVKVVQVWLPPFEKNTSRSLFNEKMLCFKFDSITNIFKS